MRRIGSDWRRSSNCCDPEQASTPGVAARKEKGISRVADVAFPPRAQSVLAFSAGLNSQLSFFLPFATFVVGKIGLKYNQKYTFGCIEFNNLNIYHRSDGYPRINLFFHDYSCTYSIKKIVRSKTT
jgi:hypothetical protein